MFISQPIEPGASERRARTGPATMPRACVRPTGALSLASRPELCERGYQARISAAQTRKAVVKARLALPSTINAPGTAPCC